MKQNNLTKNTRQDNQLYDTLLCYIDSEVDISK